MSSGSHLPCAPGLGIQVIHQFGEFPVDTYPRNVVGARLNLIHSEYCQRDLRGGCREEYLEIILGCPYSN